MKLKNKSCIIVFTEIEKQMLKPPMRSEKKNKDNNKLFFNFFLLPFCTDKIFYSRYELYFKF